MKKKVGVLLVTSVLPFLMAFKQENVQKYSEVTSSPKIMTALDAMSGTTGEWSRKAILGENLSHRPIKVSFKKLSTISSSYKEFDALGWMGTDGQLFIYINEIHRNAPPEALASLLSHEAVHQDDTSSIQEETYCWGLEATVWMQMQKRNPKLKKIAYNKYPLVDRLNTIEKMFVKANYTTKKIYQEVSTNSGYKNLPMYSPGFTKKEMQKAVTSTKNNDLPPLTSAGSIKKNPN